MRASGFLLDAHVPAAVAEGVRVVRPGCEIEHLARWRGGRYREESDDIILRACRADDLALVTYDVGTIPALLHRWIAEARSIPPVVLIPAARIGPRGIGAITRSLVALYDDASPFDSAYPVVYLHSGPR